MLRIADLTYRIGGRVLLDRANASVNGGHRIGLVGRNGTGKTTLLRLIIGALAPDGGSIEMPSRWQVGITSQDAPSGDMSLIETVIAADRELAALQTESETAHDPDRIAEIHARLADKDAHTATARAARILSGLGFDHVAQTRPCGSFSGGWRMRVALAGLLFTQPDLLLLDEPTNHLDLEATLWLEDYLRTYPGTILLVSHDRDLLNRAVGEILHLENGKLTLYQGGYDRFAETRRMRIEHSEKQRAKQTARADEIMKFVERFRYKATKAKQAQSRLKMLERMQPIAAIEQESGLTLNFPEPEELAPPLVTFDDVAVGYDGKPVLRNISLRLDADDRIALLGANGNGKSTLVKLLAGRLMPLQGDVAKSNKLRIGYFAQHQTDELDLAATPLIELSRRRPNDSEREVRSQLGRFGFSQERAKTIVGNLSGGEKARLLFALMTAAKPHLLLLDEPTNHLDIDSRDALVQAINTYNGAVILISHDPHIVELTADRFWLVEGGRVQSFDGDLADYRKRLLTARPLRAEASRSAAPRLAKSAPKPPKKRLDQAEALATRLHSEVSRLQQTLADPALYQNGASARHADLQAELRDKEQALAAAEAAWLALQEEWERTVQATG
jgi:ATP-binding cassette subfamily F protein 3